LSEKDRAAESIRAQAVAKQRRYRTNANAFSTSVRSLSTGSMINIVAGAKVKNVRFAPIEQSLLSESCGHRTLPTTRKFEWQSPASQLKYQETGQLAEHTAREPLISLE